VVIVENVNCDINDVGGREVGAGAAQANRSTGMKGQD
jgi:hypothetical protein